MLEILLFFVIVFTQTLKVQSAATTAAPFVYLRKMKVDTKDPVREFFHQSLDTVQYWFYQTFKSWLPMYNKLPWSLNHHDAVGWHKGKPVYKPWSKEELGMHHLRHQEQAEFDEYTKNI